MIRKSVRGRVSAHTLIGSHSEPGSEILVSFFANDDPSIKVDQKRTSAPKILLDGSEDLALIRSAIQAELAAYMRPSHIIPLDFLPLTLNGKIDGKKLLGVFQQTPLEDLMKLQHSGAPNRVARTAREPTDIERKVINIISRICDLPESQVLPTSNLFECGFDSLRFGALARALRAEFPTSALSVTSVMQSPVIEAIADGCSLGGEEDVAEKAADLSWLEDFSKQHRSSVQLLFRENDVEQVLPTLPIQDGILAQSMRFKNLYVQHFLYRLKEEVDLDRLENAWQKVAQRQEVLRCVVSSLDPGKVSCLIFMKGCVHSRTRDAPSCFIPSCLAIALDLPRYRRDLRFPQMVRRGGRAQDNGRDQRRHCNPTIPAQPLPVSPVFLSIRLDPPRPIRWSRVSSTYEGSGHGI